MKKRNDQPAEGGPGTHKTEAARLSAPSGGDAERCPQCGEQLQAGEKFCISCGAPVTQQQPVQAAVPVEQPKAGDKAGFLRSPAGIALIAVLCLLLAGGAAVGLFFVFKGDGDEQVQENADQAIEQAIEDINRIMKDVEDLGERFDNIDFKALDQAKVQAEEIEDDLNKASGSLENTRKDLENTDSDELLPGQKDCISILLKAADEEDLAIQEMDELLARAQAIGEFEANIDEAVFNFEAAIVTQNQASQQHREAQYVVARSTAQTALEQLGQARAYLRRASELEPDADLSGRLANIDNAERAVTTFQQMCDAMTTGDVALHNTLSDQFNAETSTVSNDLTFDYESYFVGELDGALASIANHLNKAAEFMQEAEKEPSKTSGSIRSRFFTIKPIPILS